MIRILADFCLGQSWLASADCRRRVSSLAAASIYCRVPYPESGLLSKRRQKVLKIVLIGEIPIKHSLVTRSVDVQQGRSGEDAEADYPVFTQFLPLRLAS